MTPRTWTVPLPYAKPPLSLNDRLHWRAVHALRQDIKTQVRVGCANASIPPLARAVLELHWQPAVERHRDYDNLLASYKPCADGLVAAGVLPDDDTRYLLPPVLVLHSRVKGDALVWLVVREVLDGPEKP